MAQSEIFVPIADLDAWAEFYAANREALDAIGDEPACRKIACEGGLLIGSLYVHFVD